MATYIVFDVVDVHGMVSPWRQRVTDITPDATAVTYATAVAAAAFGATKPSQGGIIDCRLEITDLIATFTPQADSDVRQNWQMGVDDVVGEVFRQGIPARNDAIALYATGSKVLANLTASVWTTLQTAMLGGAVQLQNTKSGEDGTVFERGIASVRGRKRPREGGSR